MLNASLAKPRGHPWTVYVGSGKPIFTVSPYSTSDSPVLYVVRWVDVLPAALAGDSLRRDPVSLRHAADEQFVDLMRREPAINGMRESSGVRPVQPST